MGPEHLLHVPVGHRSKDDGRCVVSVRVELPLLLQSVFDVVNSVKDLKHICVLDNFKVFQNSFSPEENLDVLKVFGLFLVITPLFRELFLKPSHELFLAGEHKFRVAYFPLENEIVVEYVYKRGIHVLILLGKLLCLCQLV